MKDDDNYAEIKVWVSSDILDPILKGLGLSINSYGVVSVSFPEYVNSKIATIPYFYQPTYEERVAISIALAEAKAKKQVDCHDLIILNHYLGIRINRGLISIMKEAYLASNE